MSLIILIHLAAYLVWPGILVLLPSIHRCRSVRRDFGSKEAGLAVYVKLYIRWKFYHRHLYILLPNVDRCRLRDNCSLEKNIVRVSRRELKLFKNLTNALLAAFMDALHYVQIIQGDASPSPASPSTGNLDRKGSESMKNAKIATWYQVNMKWCISAGRSWARFPYWQNFWGTVWISTAQWVRYT